MKMTTPLDSKHIPGFDYWVNTRGHVYSVKIDKILTDIYDGDGYAFVNMYKDGERYPKKNQHLVAENFPELVENDIPHQLWRKVYCEFDHKDGKKWRNYVDNLRWCKHKDNCYNIPVNRNNKSNGAKGIYKTQSGTFRVQITTNGLPHYQTFKTIEEAKEYAE